ncbi:hypothetical protein [Variovorax sp. YR216]|uniref:hypothetical protein n=1 Tax=Variovorax sp. YR216 TaxID=1882828 RepID=UPI00115F7C60|nr:hypothetical protein [Variovorax sp. YR216]
MAARITASVADEDRSQMHLLCSMSSTQGRSSASRTLLISAGRSQALLAVSSMRSSARRSASSLMTCSMPRACAAAASPRRDWARDALAAVEVSVLALFSAAVPVAMARELSALAYCIRTETDSTYLEWLKAPPRRRGPASLAETLEKVRFLKAVGADTWDLSGVTLAKQQAYARQVQSRRPAKTREIKSSRQMIELMCFLRITLLELTDVALLQSSRRSQYGGSRKSERAGH